MLMAIRIKATFTLRACTSQVANVIIVSFPFETRLNFHLSPFLTAGRDAAPHTSWMRTKDNTKTIPIIKNSRNNKSNIAAATTTVLFLIQTSSDANYQLSLVGIPLRHSVKEWMSFRLCWCWGWWGGAARTFSWYEPPLYSNITWFWVISDLHRGVNEIFGLLGYFTTQIGSL